MGTGNWEQELLFLIEAGQPAIQAIVQANVDLCTPLERNSNGAGESSLLSWHTVHISIASQLEKKQLKIYGRKHTKMWMAFWV